MREVEPAPWNPTRTNLQDARNDLRRASQNAPMGKAIRAGVQDEISQLAARVDELIRLIDAAGDTPTGEEKWRKGADDAD